MLGWAVGLNVITLFASLPVAFVAWVGVAMETADAARAGAKGAPVTGLDGLEVFAFVVGVFAVWTVPSWVLIYFKKPLAALLASIAPSVVGLVLAMLVERYMR